MLDLLNFSFSFHLFFWILTCSRVKQVIFIILKQIQLMSKPVKQRYEAKKFLKEKLIRYQNQINKEPTGLINYDNSQTAGNQKFGLSDYFMNSHQKSHSPNKKAGQYDHYLNCPTSEENYLQDRKSLARHNILAVNRKGKSVKSSLNDMAKHKNGIQNTYGPFSSVEISPQITPEKKQKSTFLQNKSWNKRNLDSLLMIGNSNNQKSERCWANAQGSMSQQATRPTTQQHKEKPFSSQIRSKTSTKIYSSRNKNPETPIYPIYATELTEYFTPCYHKQTKTGYIVQNFQPSLRVKNTEDNVKVWAKIIKRKIFNLEKDQIVKYLQKIGEGKKNTEPDIKIRQIVRQTNYLTQRNALQLKIRKKLRTGKTQSPRKNLYSKA